MKKKTYLFYKEYLKAVSLHNKNKSVPDWFDHTKGLGENSVFFDNNKIEIMLEIYRQLIECYQKKRFPFDKYSVDISLPFGKDDIFITDKTKTHKRIKWVKQQVRKEQCINFLSMISDKFLRMIGSLLALQKKLSK